MAKAGIGGQLIGALFDSVTPPKADRKRARKPKTNATTLGENSVPDHAQQHGELASSKEPTDAMRIRDEAKRQKRHATEEWIAGRKSTADHEHVHRRANHVLSNKKPGQFRGKSGERAMKGW